MKPLVQCTTPAEGLETKAVLEWEENVIHHQYLWETPRGAIPKRHVVFLS